MVLKMCWFNVALWIKKNAGNDHIHNFNTPSSLKLMFNELASSVILAEESMFDIHFPYYAQMMDLALNLHSHSKTLTHTV